MSWRQHLSQSLPLASLQITVPEIIGGTEPVAQFSGGGHKRRGKLASALLVVGTCIANAWPRFSISSAD